MKNRFQRKDKIKIRIFRNLFSGLPDVYGTYDLMSGKARQVKALVTDHVIKSHLMGKQPYGVYLLVKDRVQSIAVDFDSHNRMPVFEFSSSVRHYRLEAHIERSKSKGYHAWIFFKDQGVSASKARLVIKHILQEMECPDVEVFPKQDRLTSNNCYGNFINAPLFGSMVTKGKTVFVDPTTFKPYPDQWVFLELVHKHSESILDDIIELNNLSLNIPDNFFGPHIQNGHSRSLGLPICAQKMLRDGVTRYQRASCFRLAVHLKRLGLPFEMAIATLNIWAQKNRPVGRKRIITESEIKDQTSCAFKKNYRSYGCGSEAVVPFCEPDCQ